MIEDVAGLSRSMALAPTPRKEASMRFIHRLVMSAALLALPLERRRRNGLVRVPVLPGLPRLRQLPVLHQAQMK
jgi:hypothetical protein